LQMHRYAAQMIHLVGFDVSRQFTRHVAETNVVEPPVPNLVYRRKSLRVARRTSFTTRSAEAFGGQSDLVSSSFLRHHNKTKSHRDHELSRRRSISLRLLPTGHTTLRFVDKDVVSAFPDLMD
jgi:hypothetical protein